MTGLESLSRGAAALGAFVAEHLWQATVFTLLVLLLGRVLGRAPARFRYNLYLLAPLKFILPSALLWSIADGVGNGMVASLPPGLFKVFDLRESLGVGFRLLGLPYGSGGGDGTSTLWLWILAAWAAGVLVSGMLWWRRSRALRLHLQEERSESPLALGGRLAALRQRIGLRKAVGLMVTSPGVEAGENGPRLSAPRLTEPGVWGVFRPVIVLPGAMVDGLQEEELDAVLLHELVHVQRRDNLVAWALGLLRCLFWFHPLLWWLDRRLLAEREQACDERVLEVAGNPDAYLRGLAKVLRQGLDVRPVGASLASGSDLQLRIRRLRERVRPSASPFHRGVLVVALVLMAVTSLSATRLYPEASSSLQVRTARDLLREVAGTDALDPRRLPKRPPGTNRAACAKKPAPAPAPSGDACDDLRRM